jgi:hypothetical protein
MCDVVNRKFPSETPSLFYFFIGPIFQKAIIVFPVATARP